jgi:uncharacterized protein YcgI (DUF1989 family)
MKCYVDHETGLHPREVTDVESGDYLEFFAEMDTLVAVSKGPVGVPLASKWRTASWIEMFLG